MAKKYTGDVCYQDGWHWTVDGDGQPDKRLVCEDDGSYRYATDADGESWHDRKHGQYATITMDDGSPGLTVTTEELALIEELLAKKRGEG